jgi:hypothetical protein
MTVLAALLVKEVTESQYSKPYVASETHARTTGALREPEVAVLVAHHAVSWRLSQYSKPCAAAETVDGQRVQPRPERSQYSKPCAADVTRALPIPIPEKSLSQYSKPCAAIENQRASPVPS